MILEKLLNIQAELKAPKSQYNAFGKYKYRNCEDIQEAVKPLCVKYKAVLFLSDEIVHIGDRYYVKAVATLSDIESDGSICVSALAREEEDKKGMDGSQITGASSSYARKYALGGLFALDDTKDSDTTNNADKTESAPQKPDKPLTLEEAKALRSKSGLPLDRFPIEQLEAFLTCGNAEYRAAAKLIIEDRKKNRPVLEETDEKLPWEE